MTRKGNVWRAEDGRLFMQRCPRCDKENYAMAVSSGTCCWCGETARECHLQDGTGNADWPKRDHVPAEVRDDD